MTRNEEIVKFLHSKYNEIDGEFYAIEPKIKTPETDQRIIYENDNQRVQITYSFKGAFQGNVYIYVDDEKKNIFSNLLNFAKYLELCTRKNLKPKHITKHLWGLPQENKAKYEGELPTEKSKLISFLNAGDRIFVGASLEIKLPYLVSVDGEKWDLEKFSYETANQILEKLYGRHFKRIEITYKETYVRKGRVLPLNTLSLVYLNENGRVVMQYFDEKELYAGIFFENRNQAGMVDSDLLPCINFHGRNIFEQNIILDTGVLGKKCMEILMNGHVDIDSNDGYKTGFFERKYFSNKNAYMKYHDEKGEFI